MKQINVYLCGVGGQGIGMLSEVLSAACLAAGYQVRGCDTHGLAQRGGSVVSHLRLGEGAYTPQVLAGQADLVVSLERLEALRAVNKMMRHGGSVVYYDATYQPWSVRSGEREYPTVEQVGNATATKEGRVERVWIDGLEDPRMQNVALLGRLASVGAIALVEEKHFEEAIRASVPAAALEKNLTVFAAAR